MNNGINKVQVEYKSASSRSLVCISFQDEEDIVPFQLEMLKNNPVPYLLTCDVLKMDARMRLQYDVTSLLPLSKIFERKAMGKQDFLEMLAGILNLFDVMEDYLLDWGGIVLDSRYIYGSPGENKLYFIYLPIRQSVESVHEDLKELLLQWVIKEIHFFNETADNYIQKLIETLKAPEFSVGSLREYIRSLRPDVKRPVCEAQEKDMVRQPDANNVEPASMMPVSKPKVIRDSRENREGRAVPQSPFSAEPRQQKALNPQPRQNQTQTKSTVRVYPLKSYILLGCDLTGLLLLVIVLFISGSLSPNDPDMLTTLVGLLMIGGAVTYLVCSKVFTEDKKIAKEITEKQNRPMAVAKIMQPLPRPQPEKPVAEGVYVNKAIRQPVSDRAERQNPVRMPVMEAALAMERKTDRTVLLSEKNMTFPVLKRIQQPSETIPIHKIPFMIGRLEDQVDFYLANPAIGKLHAEITQREDLYALTDMNTLNGTFVNGHRVEGGRVTPIKNGDRIMLANEEFIFSTPS